MCTFQNPSRISRVRSFGSGGVIRPHCRGEGRRDARGHCSVDRKAVEQSGTAGGLQILLAAAARGVRRVPRIPAWPLAHAIVMTDLRTAGAARRPVPTGEILTTLERCPIRPRTGQDVMYVGSVAYA